MDTEKRALAAVLLLAAVGLACAWCGLLLALGGAL
jgi:hypothetical protein